MDKISDFSTLLNKRIHHIDDVIVMVKSGYPESLLTKIADLGFPVQKEWRAFNTISIRGDFALIDKILSLSWVDLVEEVQTFEPHLMYSTSQMNARGKFWDLGLTGKGQTVAVLDTGIDDSHPFFKNKIIAWKDVVGASASASGDLYSSPVDKFGHGTHVAGIIAGDGSSLNTRKVSVYDQFPQSGQRVVVGEVPRLTSTENIEIGVDWGVHGKDPSALNPVSFYITPYNNPNTLVLSKQTDTSGFDTVSFPLNAGKYLVWVSGGTPNAYFDMWINAPSESDLPSSSDGYSMYNGIAPDAQIAAVKVLDDSGSGLTGSFLDGLNWVLANKDALNITVMNMSLGTQTTVTSIDNAVNTLAEQGVVPVVSAGNEGPSAGQVGSPGSAQFAITVGAVNKYNEVAFYSSKGDPSKNPTVKPDILAPGGSPLMPALGAQSGYTDGYGVIYSADTNDRNLQAQNNDLIGYFGTSMASPHIAGLAILLVQKMKMLGMWNGDKTSTMTVKSAILSTSFEVANIGNNGGETYSGGIAPQPTIQRTGKDYYEGWGMVNAYGALSFLDRFAPLNTPISLSFDLNNPLSSNSYAYRLKGGSGRNYSISMSVPSGIDADLVLFKSSPSAIGDPLIVASSVTNGMGADESIFADVTSSEDLVLVIKLVDGSTPSNVSLLVEGDFTPSMHINSPSAGQLVKSDAVKVDFESTTSFGEILINGSSYGLLQKGDYIDTGLDDGLYNLTIVENNTLSNVWASDQIFVNMDAHAPEFLNTNFSSVPVNDTMTFDFEVTDNIAVANITLSVNDEIIAVSTDLNGSFVINSLSLPFGDLTLKLTVTDTVGYTTVLSRTLNFNHSIYIIDHGDLVLEGSNDVSITWKAGAENPDSFQISLNGTVVSGGKWDGSDIVYSFSPDSSVTFPVYSVQLTVNDTSGNEFSTTNLVSFIDTTSPTITIDLPSKEYDLTNGNPTVVVTISDFTLKEYSVTFSPNTATQIVSSEKIGRDLKLTIEITGAFVGLDLTVNAEASDIAGLASSTSSLLSVRDLTKPKIYGINNVQSEVGASYLIGWKYVEAFPKSISLKSGSDLLKSDTSPPSNGNFTYNLNELTVGNYSLKITITDEGGLSFSSSVKVEIYAVNTSSTSAAFLPFPIFGLIFVLFIRRKQPSSKPQYSQRD